MVAGQGDTEKAARAQEPVDVFRAAPAERVVPDRDAVGAPVGGVSAQRVLPGEPVGQGQVDVGAGAPGRQFPGGAAQGEGDDVLGDPVDVLDDGLLHG